MRDIEGRRRRAAHQDRHGDGRNDCRCAHETVGERRPKGTFGPPLTPPMVNRWLLPIAARKPRRCYAFAFYFNHVRGLQDQVEAGVGSRSEVVRGLEKQPDGGADRDPKYQGRKDNNDDGGIHAIHGARPCGLGNSVGIFGHANHPSTDNPLELTIFFGILKPS